MPKKSILPSRDIDLNWNKIISLSHAPPTPFFTTQKFLLSSNLLPLLLGAHGDPLKRVTMGKSGLQYRIKLAVKAVKLVPTHSSYLKSNYSMSSPSLLTKKKKTAPPRRYCLANDLESTFRTYSPFFLFLWKRSLPLSSNWKELPLPISSFSTRSRYSSGTAALSVSVS
jgi:hypothetical protein